MYTNRFLPTLFLSAFAFVSCSNNTPTENETRTPMATVQNIPTEELTAAEASVKALQTIPGKVRNVEGVQGADGSRAWEVTVEMTRDWVVTAEFGALTGGLVEMSGSFDPANFEFAPGAYFVPLSTVSLIVQRKYSSEIAHWNFRRSSQYNEWVYELDIRKPDQTKESLTMSAISRRILTERAL